MIFLIFIAGCESDFSADGALLARPKMTEVEDDGSRRNVKNGPTGGQQHEIGLISRDRLIVPIKNAKDQRLVTYDIDRMK
uniref:Uncharacterized protein n=1 Tax=Romanomermis culicivorax TaxID=13658 RepID=A0A915KC40_ROMCU